jgi:hypothetical protein
VLAVQVARAVLGEVHGRQQDVVVGHDGLPALGLPVRRLHNAWVRQPRLSKQRDTKHLHVQSAWHGMRSALLGQAFVENMVQ